MIVSRSKSPLTRLHTSQPSSSDGQEAFELHRKEVPCELLTSSNQLRIRMGSPCGGDTIYREIPRRVSLVIVDEVASAVLDA